MEKSLYITKIGNYNDLFKSAQTVREKVFVDEQGDTHDNEFDPFDRSATHVVIFDGEAPIATARLIFKDAQWQIGRVAVLIEYRGQKLGARVMIDLLEYAKTKNTNEIHIHSQCHAQGFYEKLGFRPYGEVFVEADIDHISMVWVK